MIRVIIAWCTLTLAATAAEPVAELFNQAESLARSNRNDEAMEKIEQAIAEVDRSVAAGERITRLGMESFRLASKLAREDFLDYKRSLEFCKKMEKYADSDYWRVPALLETATTYRAMGDFKNAQKQYDLVAAAEERQQMRMLIPQAEMVYFDMGDKEKGRKLLEEALMNENINSRERYNSLRKCAEKALSKGDREEALQWYKLLEKLPFEKPGERAQFLSQAWYEMGKIEESRGRTAQAKAIYRRVMELEDGEMRYRARARRALESIEYFE